MPNLNQPQVPVSGSPNAIISRVNNLWGRVGSGSPNFWRVWNPMVFRDTVATDVQPGGLQSLDSFYDLIVTEGLTYEFKGDTEKRNLSSLAGLIMVGPVRSERVDGPAVPIPLRPGYDPAGRIRQAIRDNFSKWSDFLPLKTITRLVMNGRLSTKHPTQTAVDKVVLFSANHRINHLSATNTAVYPNTITLGAAVDEAAWAATTDLILQCPDLDGQTLPNADNAEGLMPLIMVPTKAQQIRWAHILGGPNLPKELFQQGNSAGISSVVVGEAEIMLNPYMLTEAEDKNAAKKRTIVFTRNGRKPVIYLEEQTPTITDTGPNGAQAHSHNQQVLYIQAFVTAQIAEWRSIFEVVEP